MNSKSPVSVLVVDDDVVSLEGIQTYLIRQGFLVHSAIGYNDGLTSFGACQPIVTILDIRLTRNSVGKVQVESGLELAKHFRRLNSQVHLIFRSAYTHYQLPVLEFVEKGHGGVAYLYKGGGRPAELTRALKIVLDRGVYFDPQIQVSGCSVADIALQTLAPEERDLVALILPQFKTLTPREFDALGVLSWSRHAAAEQLGISVRTIDRHITNLYEKLNLIHEQYPEIRQDVILAKAYLIWRLQQCEA